MAAHDDGRVMLITGASTGIGARTARVAAERGWRVALGARTASKLEGVAAEIGDRAVALPTDVADFDQQKALVDAALERFGRLDAAFANAGFGGPRGFLNDTPEHWREMVLTNVYGAALTIRATIPALRAVSYTHLTLPTNREV